MLKRAIFFVALILFLQCSSDQDAHDHAAHASRDHSSDSSHRGKRFDYQRIKSVAEDSMRNFNPGFVRSFHSARVYTIRDHKIYDSLIRVRNQTMPVIKTVAGEVPSRNAKGSFHVAFLTEKDTVYKYSMESPLYVRIENGPDKGLFKVKAGSFLVPLPPVKNVTKIVLRDNDGTELVSTFR